MWLQKVGHLYLIFLKDNILPGDVRYRYVTTPQFWSIPRQTAQHLLEPFLRQLTIVVVCNIIYIYIYIYMRAIMFIQLLPFRPVLLCFRPNICERLCFIQQILHF